jgi:methyl-accepting chemotaxis protein
MKNLKLKTKLIGGFLVIAAALLLGGWVGVSGIAGVSKNLRSFVEVRVLETEALTDMIARHSEIAAMQQRLLAPENVENGAEKERLLKGLEETWGRADVASKKYDTLPKSEDTDIVWKKIQSARESLRKADAEFVGLIGAGKRVEAHQMMNAQLSVATEDNLLLMKNLSDTSTKGSDLASSNATRGAHRAKNAALAGTAVGIVLAVVLAFYFIRTVVRPIHRVIASLTDTSAPFSKAAEQISQSSCDLAEGTARQAAAVEETQSVMEELKALNGNYTEVINDLKNKLGQTNTIGMEAFEMMKTAKKAMKGIMKTSEETASIVQSIEKIAFQTNLLALNASVEAARAGQAGSGFAGVSEDIRGLGTRSTEAAKHSIALIGKTIGIAGKGNEYIGLSIKKFIEYGTSSVQIYTYSQEAAKMAEKQLRDVNGIHALIEEISRWAQSNAAAAEEASSVSEETAAQALSVKSAVGELAAVVGYRMKG